MIREIDVMIKKQEEEIRNSIRERGQMEFELELRDSYISVTQKSIERLNELKGLIEENSSNQVTGIMNDVGCMNIDKNRRTIMKAKLYGIEVEGTPDEIAQLKAKLDQQSVNKVNQTQYPIWPHFFPSVSAGTVTGSISSSMKYGDIGSSL